MRLCFFGDSFVNGVGDVEALGWRGRVTATVRRAGLDITAYDLGIRRDTSAHIRARWHSEAAARCPPGPPARLLFAFGTNDCADDGRGSPRLTLDNTLGHADAILRAATMLAPTLMIGPAPMLDDAAADARIAALDTALARLAAGHGVPYLPVFHVLRAAPDWTKGAAAGDGTHPDCAGYAFMADLVLEWPAFRRWIGLA